jgi:hypothetical protein
MYLLALFCSSVKSVIVNLDLRMDILYRFKKKKSCTLSGKVETSHYGLFMCVGPTVGITDFQVWPGSENKTRWHLKEVVRIPKAIVLAKNNCVVTNHYHSEVLSPLITI